MGGNQRRWDPVELGRKKLNLIKSETSTKRNGKKGDWSTYLRNPAGKKKFVLDDLKFSRKEMDEIVRLVESKIPREMITNGEPEKVPGSDAENRDSAASSEADQLG